jgi:hypothetical protein
MVFVKLLQSGAVSIHLRGEGGHPLENASGDVFASGQRYASDDVRDGWKRTAYSTRRPPVCADVDRKTSRRPDVGSFKTSPS